MARPFRRNLRSKASRRSAIREQERKPPEAKIDDEIPKCHFCGEPRSGSRMLVRSDHGYKICEACVMEAVEVFAAAKAVAQAAVGSSKPCTGDPPEQPQSGVKPGVAYGNTKDGSSVYTLDDAKKAGDASAPSDGPKGLNWVDKNQDLKRAIPPPAAPQINDLGPSTNEPEQKTKDAAVARNDEARLGDDIAQRI
jgi:hypothetical protein